MSTTTSKTIAVFGATGAQGAPVVVEGLAKGMNVRAIGRNAEKIKEMHPAAVAFEASLDNETALIKALDGVDAAFLHLPMPRDPSDPEVWLKTFITAAHRVALPLIVYTTSGPTGPRYGSSIVIDGGTGGMQAVLNCGIPTIVLQPAIYLENLFPEIFLPKLRTEGILDYPPLPATSKVQWTSHLDQARIAVAALERPDLAGKSYEIGTPNALTGVELAELVAAWLGRPVNFDPMTPADFGERVGKAIGNPGAGFALNDIYGALAKLSDEGMVIDTAALEEVFKVKLTTVAEHLASWAK